MRLLSKLENPVHPSWLFETMSDSLHFLRTLRTPSYKQSVLTRAVSGGHSTASVAKPTPQAGDATILLLYVYTFFLKLKRCNTTRRCRLTRRALPSTSSTSSSRPSWDGVRRRISVRLSNGSTEELWFTRSINSWQRKGRRSKIERSAVRARLYVSHAQKTRKRRCYLWTDGTDNNDERRRRHPTRTTGRKRPRRSRVEKTGNVCGIFRQKRRQRWPIQPLG